MAPKAVGRLIWLENKCFLLAVTSRKAEFLEHQDYRLLEADGYKFLIDISGRIRELTVAAFGSGTEQPQGLLQALTRATRLYYDIVKLVWIQSNGNDKTLSEGYPKLYGLFTGQQPTAITYGAPSVDCATILDDLELFPRLLGQIVFYVHLAETTRVLIFFTQSDPISLYLLNADSAGVGRIIGYLQANQKQILYLERPNHCPEPAVATNDRCISVEEEALQWLRQIERRDHKHRWDIMDHLLAYVLDEAGAVDNVLLEAVFNILLPVWGWSQKNLAAKNSLAYIETYYNVLVLLRRLNRVHQETSFVAGLKPFPYENKNTNRWICFANVANHLIQTHPAFEDAVNRWHTLNPNVTRAKAVLEGAAPMSDVYAFVYDVIGDRTLKGQDLPFYMYLLQGYLHTIGPIEFETTFANLLYPAVFDIECQNCQTQQTISGFMFCLADCELVSPDRNAHLTLEPCTTCHSFFVRIHCKTMLPDTPRLAHIIHPSVSAKAEITLHQIAYQILLQSMVMGIHIKTVINRGPELSAVIIDDGVYSLSNLPQSEDAQAMGLYIDGQQVHLEYNLILRTFTADRMVHRNEHLLINKPWTRTKCQQYLAEIVKADYLWKEGK